MKDHVICEVIKFDGNMPVMVVHHTDASSRDYPSHWHLDMEINILYEGKIDFYIGGRHEELTAGTFCLINSKEIHNSVPHMEKKKGKIVGFTLLIDHGFLSNMIDGYSDVFFRVDHIREKQQIALLLYQISDLCLAERSCSTNLRVLSLVCEILSVLCEKCKYRISDIDINHQKEWERIRIICEYIHNHYKLPLQQQVLAEKFYFSRGYFASFFKKYTGKTFKQYLTEVRLNESEKLLLKTENSILQIAYDTGFSDERRFIETFKQYYKMTPGIYRKKMKEN